MLYLFLGVPKLLDLRQAGTEYTQKERHHLTFNWETHPVFPVLAVQKNLESKRGSQDSEKEIKDSGKKSVPQEMTQGEREKDKNVKGEKPIPGDR